MLIWYKVNEIWQLLFLFFVCSYKLQFLTIPILKWFALIFCSHGISKSFSAVYLAKFKCVFKLPVITLAVINANDTLAFFWETNTHTQGRGKGVLTQRHTTTLLKWMWILLFIWKLNCKRKFLSKLRTYIRVLYALLLTEVEIEYWVKGLWRPWHL